MVYDKERIYDEQIAPLMAQILEITSREGIQMLASFALQNEEAGGENGAMKCTSYTPGDSWDSQELLEARAVVMGNKKAVSNMAYALIIARGE